MNIDNELEKLKKIRRQEAPDWLMTRIRSKISAMEDLAVPRQWKWAFAVAASLLIALNVLALSVNNHRSGKTGINELIQNMQLSTSNELYDE